MIRPLCVALLTVASSGITLTKELHPSVGHSAASERNLVYHLHIPKAAGISWMSDEMSILKRHGLKQVSQEGCFSFQDSNPRILGTAVMLRNPREHILSMYHFCMESFTKDYQDLVRQPGSPGMPQTFEGWLTEWRRLQDSGWHGNFTPSPSQVTENSLNYEGLVRHARMAAWSAPPFVPSFTWLRESDWPRLDGGGTIWHFVKAPFQCYSPFSFQTQRLSCQNAMEWPETPNISAEVDNVDSAWFVGLVEQYQASVCLLRLKLGEAPPRYCDCSHPEQWRTFPGLKLNKNSHPEVDDMSQESLVKMDRLAAADWQLYKAGQKRFVRDVLEMEQKHNIKLLCNFSVI